LSDLLNFFGYLRIAVETKLAQKSLDTPHHGDCTVEVFARDHFDKMFRSDGCPLVVCNHGQIALSGFATDQAEFSTLGWCDHVSFPGHRIELFLGQVFQASFVTTCVLHDPIHGCDMLVAFFPLALVKNSTGDCGAMLFVDSFCSQLGLLFVRYWILLVEGNSNSNSTGSI